MSERNVRPATADNVGWNTTPTNPSTDPGGAVRAAGWATDAIPGSDEFNYLQTMWGDFLQWLEGMAPREWTQLTEAIAASSPGDRLRVVNASGAFHNRMSAAYVVTGTAATGGQVQYLCTDGEQLYYISGSTNLAIIAADPADGGEIWEVVRSQEVIAICTDGGRVYMVSNASDTGLTTLSRVNGSQLDNAGTTYGHVRLAAQGYYCAGISGSGGAGTVDIWVSDPVSLVGTGSTGSAQLRGLAVDHRNAIVGGDRNTDDIWAYRLSDAGLDWSVTLDANAFTVRAICTDGNRIYVACDRDALSAGGNANLFCLSPVDGSLLWSYDLGTVDLYAIAVDDRYLYPVDKNGNCYMMDLRGYGLPSIVAFGGAFSDICADGVSIYGPDFGTPTDFGRYYSGVTQRTFLRVTGTDQFRRPFYALAVPID